LPISVCIVALLQFFQNGLIQNAAIYASELCLALLYFTFARVPLLLLCCQAFFIGGISLVQPILYLLFLHHRANFNTIFSQHIRPLPKLVFFTHIAKTTLGVGAYQ
jgi:hypothetical protein